MSIPADWSQFKDLMAALPRNDVHRVIRFARRELTTRYREREAWKERLSEGFRAMANFMAGVTWALSCRAALRESKGHPAVGKRPQSGEMWMPRELLYAVRHQVKERGWHPVTTDFWATFRQHMLGELARRPVRESMGVEEPLHVVQFAVRMAAPVYASRIIDTRCEERFDLGGEG